MACFIYRRSLHQLTRDNDMQEGGRRQPCFLIKSHHFLKERVLPFATDGQFPFKFPCVCTFQGLRSFYLGMILSTVLLGLWQTKSRNAVLGCPSKSRRSAVPMRSHISFLPQSPSGGIGVHRIDALPCFEPTSVSRYLNSLASLCTEVFCSCNLTTGDEVGIRLCRGLCR